MKKEEGKLLKVWVKLVSMSDLVNITLEMKYQPPRSKFGSRPFKGYGGINIGEAVGKLQKRALENNLAIAPSSTKDRGWPQRLLVTRRGIPSQEDYDRHARDIATEFMTLQNPLVAHYEPCYGYFIEKTEVPR